MDSVLSTLGDIAVEALLSTGRCDRDKRPHTRDETRWPPEREEVQCDGGAAQHAVSTTPPLFALVANPALPRSGSHVVQLARPQPELVEDRCGLTVRSHRIVERPVVVECRVDVLYGDLLAQRDHVQLHDDLA